MKFVNKNPVSRIFCYFSDFYSEHFNGTLPENLSVEINMKQKRDSAYPCGYFYPKTDRIEIFVKNCRTREGILLALSHEMIHANQKARGDFEFDSERKLFLWKNRIYNKKDCGRIYPNLPWEQEAYRDQKKVAEKAVYWLALQNDDRIYHYRDMVV